MGVFGGLLRNNGVFEDITDLIIVLIVLEFLCKCVFDNRKRIC